MRANAPKRKVFQDAVDLISPSEEMINSVNSGQTMIVRVIGSKLLLYHFGIKAVIIPKYHGDTN